MAVVENPGLYQLDHDLRAHPRVAALLRDPVTSEAAEAALRFFIWAERPFTDEMPPAEKKRRKAWLSPNVITWRDIRKVYCGLAAVAEPPWIDTDSNDHTTLRTGHCRLRIGDVFEMKGVDRHWWVTNIMGKPGTFHAVLAQQGTDLPAGRQEWRLVASSAQFLDEVPEHHPLAVGGEAPRPGECRTATDPPHRVDPHEPRPRTGSSSGGTLDTIKRHPVVVTLAALAAVVVAVGQFTSGLDQILIFLKKYVLR